jgi:hypothetical protein
VAVALPGIGRAQAAPPFQQAANPLTLDVRVGFDSYIQPDTWVPVTVTASNDGPDVVGELRIQVDALTAGRTFYTYPLELPRGSRKQVTLYPADVVTFNNVVQIDFISERRVVAGQKVRVQSVEQTALLVGAWSDTPGALASLGKVKSTGGKATVATVTEVDLPPVADGWSALDVLVIYDADTGKLSPEQRAALRGWIEAGGRLIVAGGASFQRTLSGLSELTPLEATSTITVSVEPLSMAVGTPFGQQTSHDALAAAGPLASDARVLYTSGDVPLIAWRQLGFGRVDFLAADPGLEPLRSWPAMQTLWMQILADGEARPGWAYGFSSQWDTARQAVAAVPGVSLPSVLQLCGFLIVYVILIGPVNYIILWRLKRRELAWITVPLLVILFSAIAYLTGFQLRGSQVILHRLAVIQSWQGEDTANVETLMGVWSPRRAGYDIALEAGYLARPLPRDLSGALTSVADTTIEDGQAVTLRRVQVDVGSVQPFIIEGVTQNVPRIEGHLTLSSSDRGLRLEGDIINSSDVPMTHVGLVLAGGVNELADLPAGGVLHVDTVFSSGTAIQSSGSGLDPYPLSPNSGYAYGPYGYENTLAAQIADADNCYDVTQSDNMRRCNLVSSVLVSEGRGEGVYLVGWSDQVPFRTEVLNATSETYDSALYIIQMDVGLDENNQTMDTIPPGLMTWQVLENPSGYYYGVSPYDLYLDPANTLVFRFQPVSLVPVSPIKSLVIHLTSYDTSVSAPRVEIWNYDSGHWESVQVTWGDNRVEDAAPYVDANGGVDLRIRTAEDYGSSLTRFDVTLLGQ